MEATTPRLLVACSSCRRQFDATGFAAGSRFRCSCGQLVTVGEARSHDAAVVRCSSCGAPRHATAASCEHCGADYTLHERDLDTICAACLTRVSGRASYCHACGTPIAPQGRVGEPTEHPCPACGTRSRLHSRSIGSVPLAVLECARCAGLWLGPEALELVVERARTRTAPEEIVRNAAPAAAEPPVTPGPAYRRCPLCRRHMNRRNFGRSSGVIVDACRDHGVWFDVTELDAVLRWIHEGGEQRAARREGDEEREVERQRAIKFPKLERAMAPGGRPPASWEESPAAELLGESPRLAVRALVSLQPEATGSPRTLMEGRLGPFGVDTGSMALYSSTVQVRRTSWRTAPPTRRHGPISRASATASPRRASPT